MQALSLDAYLRSNAKQNDPEKHDTTAEYDNFRREFDQWAIEMGGQMRNGVEAVLQPRNAFDAPTISLMSSIEADDATDKSQVANIDQVLCTYPDAGFAKCFNYFDLSNNSRLPDDQAGFIYPFLKTNMVIFGSIQTADRQELNINVERIMEPGLEQLPVLSLRGLIYSEDYFEPSAVNPERHLLLPGTFVLAGIMRVPGDSHSPLILTLRPSRVNLSALSSRQLFLGICDDRWAWSPLLSGSTHPLADVTTAIKTDTSFENPTSVIAMQWAYGVDDYVSLRPALPMEKRGFVENVRSDQSTLWAEDIAHSAFRHFARGNVDKSMDLFNQALVQDPYCPSAHLGKAMVYGTEQDFERAVKYLHLALDYKAPMEEVTKVIRRLNVKHVAETGRPLPLDPQYRHLLVDTSLPRDTSRQPYPSTASSHSSSSHRHYDSNTSSYASLNDYQPTTLRSPPSSMAFPPPTSTSYPPSYGHYERHGDSRNGHRGDQRSHHDDSRSRTSSQDYHRSDNRSHAPRYDDRAQQHRSHNRYDDERHSGKAAPSSAIPILRGTSIQRDHEDYQDSKYHDDRGRDQDRPHGRDRHYDQRGGKDEWRGDDRRERQYLGDSRSRYHGDSRSHSYSHDRREHQDRHRPSHDDEGRNRAESSSSSYHRSSSSYRNQDSSSQDYSSRSTESRHESSTDSSQGSTWMRPSQAPPHELSGLRMKRSAGGSSRSSSGSNWMTNLNEMVIAPVEDMSIETQPSGSEGVRKKRPHPGSPHSSHKEPRYR